MTLPEALDILSARQPTARLRWLCSAENPRTGPHGREAYRRWVLAEAARPAPPEPDLARLDRALAAAGTGRKPGGCCPGA